jgi:type IV secretory pathway TraG/TraD family ATPase VirD4
MDNETNKNDATGYTPDKNASFNPFAFLDPPSRSFAADCDKLADALITHGPDGEDHWTAIARSLTAAIVQCVASKSFGVKTNDENERK